MYWKISCHQGTHELFKSRNESHRFVVLAPTGTAAALLHGSTYHSILGVPIDVAEKRSRGRKSKTSGKHMSNEISSTLQKVIWDLPPSATNHFPGKLSLCIGMPVIIRNNDATELCITKGQEGHVVGWQAGIGIHGK